MTPPPRDMLTADACRDFRPACRGFAQALADAGLHLPGVGPAVRSPVPATDAAPRARHGAGLP
ncbi:MAG TPA: hypothetical protein VD995_12590 [Azospirillum sp.]|nr:hypothetical protein [Azospirillum sp.]